MALNHEWEAYAMDNDVLLSKEYAISCAENMNTFRGPESWQGHCQLLPATTADKQSKPNSTSHQRNKTTSQHFSIAAVYWNYCISGQKSNSLMFEIAIYISQQKYLGYFNHIVRLSELHQCGQGVLQTRLSLGAFSVPLVSLIFQKTYLSTFLALLPQPCNQGTIQGQLCRIKERN